MDCQIIVGRVALRDLGEIREFIARDDAAVAEAFAESCWITPQAWRRSPTAADICASGPEHGFR